ncbi:hypothetical protein C0Z18_05435 [Trinickia dabaoshanensis]|uniref:Uncharacterized protein n=1 Tax=Trinickia dabaoshanensis TaxID=564714 RepID=A0A2N7VXU3_9BURK|nr:hypothetical protein C0Z18_05435 [Trinickia dabaoshanensis]
MFVGDGSILVARPFCGLTNSDAFFTFSDTRVRFGQVRCAGPRSPCDAARLHRDQAEFGSHWGSRARPRCNIGHLISRV